VHEADQFNTVSEIWHKVMGYVEDDPKVLNIDKIPNLLNDLKLSLRYIEEI